MHVFKDGHRAIRLSQFDFEVQYVRGSEMHNSDFMSRLPLRETVPIDEPQEIIFAIRSLNNMPITCHDIMQHTDKDKRLVKLKQYIRTGFPSVLDESLMQFKNIASELSIVHGCIMYRNRVFIPESIRSEVLNQFHETHPGLSSMKIWARGLIYFPGLDKDIESLCRSCKICQNSQAKPPQCSTMEWPVPAKNWSRIHIDHFQFEDKLFLIAIDAKSKFIECKIVNSTSSKCTIQALREIFASQGICDVIVSDNASGYISSEFQDFLQNNGIKHVPPPPSPPPFQPATNGQIERSCRLMKALLKKNKEGSLHCRLANALLYCRTTPHSVTKVAPCFALNGRKFITLKDKINPLNISLLSKKEGKKVRSFNVGDYVLALNYGRGPKWYHGVIIEKININIFKVRVSDLNVVWRRHSNQLLSSVKMKNEHDNIR